MNNTIKWRASTGPALCLLVAGIVLAGCASSESEPTATNDAAATTTTTVGASTTTGATTATTVPVTATTIGPASTETCVTCHTDEEALQVLAVEPPDLEVLSEGEG